MTPSSSTNRVRSSLAATFLFLAVLFGAGPAARAQDTSATRSQEVLLPDSVFAVDSVIIQGNEKTHDFVILREMKLKPGVLITSEGMQYDQHRIYSLGLFNQVQMWVSPTGTTKANVFVQVVERWYLVPYPILGLKEGKWSKAFYGLGLVHTNFRGRNEKLYVSGALGYDPFGSLAYRNPFLDNEGSTFFEGRIAYSKVRNRSTQVLVHPTDLFDEKHFSTAVTFGKRYGNEQTAWISGEYQVVTIDDYFPPPTISATGTDRFPTLTIGYAYDSRDLLEYPGSGTLFTVSVTKYGIPGQEFDFARYGFDLRRFIPTGTPFTLAGRAYTNLIAGGRSPSYNHVYFGYQYKVRGHYTDVLEGENIFGVSTEVHYTLLPPVYFKVHFLPSQLGVWKFSMTLAAFADAGMVWYRGDVFTLDNTLRGYGGGIHFGLPYSIVLRTEYAWNQFRQGQFILDIGAAF